MAELALSHRLAQSAKFTRTAGLNVRVWVLRHVMDICPRSSAQPVELVIGIIHFNGKSDAHFHSPHHCILPRGDIGSRVRLYAGTAPDSPFADEVQHGDPERRKGNEEIDVIRDR